MLRCDLVQIKVFQAVRLLEFSIQVSSKPEL